MPVVYPYIPYPIGSGICQWMFHLLRTPARDHTIEMFAHSTERSMQTCLGHFGWRSVAQELTEHFQPAEDSHAHN